MQNGFSICAMSYFRVKLNSISIFSINFKSSTFYTFSTGNYLKIVYVDVDAGLALEDGLGFEIEDGLGFEILVG